LLIDSQRLPERLKTCESTDSKSFDTDENYSTERSYILFIGANKWLPETLAAASKDLPSRKAVNTSTGPQLPKDISVFDSLDLPWKIGPPAKHLRCHLLPQVQTQKTNDDIFLARILGHKLLGPNASLLVGHSISIFSFDSPEPYL
jgi:hypothetical protein